MGEGCLFSVVELFIALFAPSGSSAGDNARVGTYFMVIGGLGTLGCLGWYLIARPHPVSDWAWFLCWLFPLLLVVGGVWVLYYRWKD